MPLAHIYTHMLAVEWHTHAEDCKKITRTYTQRWGETGVGRFCKFRQTIGGLQYYRTHPHIHIQNQQLNCNDFILNVGKLSTHTVMIIIRQHRKHTMYTRPPLQAGSIINYVSWEEERERRENVKVTSLQDRRLYRHTLPLSVSTTLSPHSQRQATVCVH
jgi:hypothetical protein